MRIISSYSDYYDCVQAQGQDQSVLYLREPKEVKSDSFQFLSKLCRWTSDIVKQPILAGFCGKIVPLLRIGDPSPTSNVKPIFAYNIDEVDAFVGKHFKKPAIEEYFAPKRRGYWSTNWRYAKRRALVEFFNTKVSHPTDYPTFLGYRDKIVYNACLKDVEFYRVVDPYTAFQEIAMFLGSLAAPEKPLPKIDDKTMAEAKGFDKFSFRKPKCN